MAESLPDEEIESFKRCFLLFDKNGDGVITADEVGEVMRSLGLNVSEKALREMVSELDTNKNGVVDYNEFLAMMVKRRTQPGNDETDYREAFKIFDKDGNGVISSQELQSVMSALGESLSAEDADRLIREADSDGDGLINYEDFVNRLCKCTR